MIGWQKEQNSHANPTCTSVINIVCISCAISQLTGFLQCRAIFRPSWLGYWHVFSGLQYCARSWRCFGQIVNFFISSNGRLNFPTLANINSCSVTFVRDRSQLFKWFLTSATHSARGITSSFPRDSKQIMFLFQWTNMRSVLSLLSPWLLLEAIFTLTVCSAAMHVVSGVKGTSRDSQRMTTCSFSIKIRDKLPRFTDNYAKSSYIGCFLTY